MLNIFLIILEWIGIWDGLNFLFCCLKSFMNNFRIEDVLLNYNNSVIPYLSFKKTGFGKKRFYIFFIYLMSLLFNIIFWNELMIYYLIPIFTIPWVSEYMIELNWMNKLYHKSINFIKKSVKLFFSNQLSNLFNFVGTNVLDAKTNFNKHEIYYWINTINNEKIWASIKSLSYCSVIIYLSSSDYLKYLPSFSSKNKHLVYHKDNIKYLLENKQIDKILESDSIYSIYNIFKNSTNNKIKILIQQKINHLNFIMSTIYLLWSCTSILSYFEIPYGFSLSLATILLKSYFMPLKIDVLFILFLSSFIPSPPIIMLLSWFFTFKSFYLNINIEFLISISLILFNIFIMWLNITNSFYKILFYVLNNFGLIYLINYLVKIKYDKYICSDNLSLIKNHIIKIVFLNIMLLLNGFNLAHIISVGAIYYYFHVLYKVKKIKEIELKIVHNHFKKLNKSMMESNIVRLSKSNSNVNLELNQKNLNNNIINSNVKENKIKPISDYFSLEKNIFHNKKTN
jgi:hypothetical protein